MTGRLLLLRGGFPFSSATSTSTAAAAAVSAIVPVIIAAIPFGRSSRIGGVVSVLIVIRFSLLPAGDQRFVIVFEIDILDFLLKRRNLDDDVDDFDRLPRFGRGSFYTRLLRSGFGRFIVLHDPGSEIQFLVRRG